MKVDSEVEKFHSKRHSTGQKIMEAGEKNLLPITSSEGEPSMPIMCESNVLSN